MRAVTWTQVAQYIILIVAYMIPVVWLSVKQTGVPIPQAIYGYQLREGHRAREKQLIDDPKEKEVIAIFKAAPTTWPPSSRTCRRAGGRQGRAPEEGGRPEGRQRPVAEMQAAEKALAPCPRTRRRQGRLDQGQGRSRWPRQAAGRHAAHAAQFAGDPMATPRRRRPSTKSRATSWPWCSA
jgi:cation/acetate symporter